MDISAMHGNAGLKMDMKKIFDLNNKVRSLEDVIIVLCH